MTEVATADVVIFGGGIAGLWLLNRLRREGYSVILFESGALGGGQTHKAQGIIHGGMKYALQGKLTEEVYALCEAPSFWKNCLKGQGDVDLSAVSLLSPQHYLWSLNKFMAKLTGFMASNALNSKVITLSQTAYPSIFKNPAFKGEVFALDEIVIDVLSLIRELVKLNQDAVYKIDPLSPGCLTFKDERCVKATITTAGSAIEVAAQQFIFAAGAGNEFIIKHFNQQDIAMQRRPLHMVLAKLPFDYPLYAHCLGFGPRPRITITTHYTADGSPIWYMGGELSENGIERDSSQQIQAARKELRELFPWLDFSLASFRSFIIDRAEPKQKSGLKPDGAYYRAIQNTIIAWPTKLALAPQLAEDIVKHLHRESVIPLHGDMRSLRAWPMPPLACPIWETMFCKDVA